METLVSYGENWNVEMLIPDVVEYPAQIDHAQYLASLNANTIATKRGSHMCSTPVSNTLGYLTILGHSGRGRISGREQATFSLSIKDTVGYHDGGHASACSTPMACNTDSRPL